MEFVDTHHLVNECKYDEPNENTRIKTCFLDVERNMGQIWNARKEDKKMIETLQEKDTKQENQLSVI